MRRDVSKTTQVDITIASDEGHSLWCAIWENWCSHSGDSTSSVITINKRCLSFDIFFSARRRFQLFSRSFCATLIKLYYRLMTALTRFNQIIVCGALSGCHFQNCSNICWICLKFSSQACLGINHHKNQQNLKRKTLKFTENITGYIGSFC